MINLKTSDLVKRIKVTCLKLSHNANASHLGGAFSIADILAVLYSKVLNVNPQDPKWSGRDRLFYSKGHACTSLYAVLQEAGFYDEKALLTFSSNGSLFTTHVNHKIPGVEFSTGSLGHALSVACGVAYAGKRRKNDWHVFAILSDGELDEGSNWEAILFAPHHKLNNLTVIIDYNKIQSLGSVCDVLNLDSLTDKFKSFNWNVIEINGHDHDEIYQALQNSKHHEYKPSVIIANTIKGKGVDFMENQLAWHYKSPDKNQLESAIEQINTE